MAFIIRRNKDGSMILYVVHHGYVETCRLVHAVAVFQFVTLLPSPGIVDITAGARLCASPLGTLALARASTTQLEIDSNQVL